LRLRRYINRRYLIYGLSIVLSRGFELAVMFFAAKYLAKALYGQLEYYKKVLELGGVFLSFGFPALIMTYTRSKSSKVYMLLYASLFVGLLSLALLPILYVLRWQTLWPAFLFYALFFTGGIFQLYVLVKAGSDRAAMYKAGVSALFYTGVLLYVLFAPHPQYAFVYTARLLMIPGLALLFYEWSRYGIRFHEFIRYARLFFRLTFAAFTLLLSNFTNLMFLYTDIFIIKLLSRNPMPEIADYSFALNAANVLMLIPLSLVQTDIEKIKRRLPYARQLHGKIRVLVGAAIPVLILLYILLTRKFFPRYAHTLVIFLIILAAKYFQAQGVLFGTTILVLKKFRINILINLLMIVFNIVAGYVLYMEAGLPGVALAGALSLFLRFILLRYFFNRLVRYSEG